MGSSTAFAKSSDRIPPIDYTSRDFQSISDDMVRAIPFFTPEWTDFNLSDFGIVLQRLLAFVADTLHFYLDRVANEAFLPTAITRRSVINLLRLIDYTVPSAVPASVDLVFTLATAQIADVLIPAGTPVQTSADSTDTPIIFETVADLIILAGQLTGTVSAVEGQSESENVGVSSGLPRQRFTLSGTPIIDGTLRIFIDEGAGEQLWTQVDTFISSGPTDKNFTAQRDENNIITIFFGDNVQGKIPVPTSPIRAAYRIGGGFRGNVGAHTINTINTVITLFAVPVNLSVDNPLQASGGEDEMSIDDAKVLGPLSLKTLNRAVTPQDYVDLALLFPGIAKASVSLGGAVVNPDAGCCCQLALSIVPQGGGPPSTILKESLLEYFDSRKMAGTCIIIKDPVYQPIRVTGTVFLASNFATEQAAVDINTVIEEYFSLDGQFSGLGEPANLSNIMRLLDSIEGVNHVDLTEFTLQPVPDTTLMHGGCTIPSVAIGEQSKEEEWTVIFISASEYTVRGTVSGIQTAQGTTGLPYTSDKGEVSFTVVCSGPGSPLVGDRITFFTSRKRDDVPMPGNSIMQKGEVNITIVGGSRTQKECINS